MISSVAHRVTHNVLGLGEVGGLEVQMFNLALMLIEVQMLKLALMPPFCQTPVLVAQLKYTNKFV